MGVKRQEAFYDVLRDYFYKKVTISEAVKILQDAKNLKVEVGENVKDME